MVCEAAVFLAIAARPVTTVAVMMIRELVLTLNVSVVGCATTSHLLKIAKAASSCLNEN